MTPPAGKLYLVPNALDFGIEGSLAGLDETLATGVIRVASRLEHWVVENAKTARAFLKRVDVVTPLSRPLQQISIVELPRQMKGNHRAARPSLQALLAPARQGHDIGLLSEAGLPAIADPGAALVEQAHCQRVSVVALPGPSSLMLALAASGLNGQGFAFVGYLPVEASERVARIRALERQSRHDGLTRLMIETPYRNQALLDALVQHLNDATRLSVSCALTSKAGLTLTQPAADWRAQDVKLPKDLPAVFLLLGSRAEQ